MPTDFEKEIAEHEAKIVELRAEQAAFDAMPTDERMAVHLHDALCQWNHADGCGWFYEIHKNQHDWHGNAHRSWRGKVKVVRNLLPGMDDETIIKVVSAIKGL